MINELVSCTYTHTHTQCFAIVFLQATLGFVYAETFAAFSLSFVFASSSLKLLARANAQLLLLRLFPIFLRGVEEDEGNVNHRSKSREGTAECVLDRVGSPLSSSRHSAVNLPGVQLCYPE
jgi:hypothetical protein